jgi:hypothetical protein
VSKRVSTLVFSLSVWAGCTGTETGNPPVIDFGNSGCLAHGAVDKGVLLQSLDEPGPSYAGLTCLSFEGAENQTVRIDLHNYESGCSTDQGWVPHTELRDDGGLDIVLQDNDCSVAKCGWCIYDLSFTIRLDAPLPDGEVRVYQQGCGDTSRQEKRAVLALASQAEGAACSYAHGGALSWLAKGKGERGMPCNLTSSQGGVRCDEGLVCSDVGPVDQASGGTRCLPACSSDADCDALTACQAGVCRLTATGLGAIY